MDKTFAAIEKLKEINLELHRLKNALEMMNRAHEANREWVGLTYEEIKLIWKESPHVVGLYTYTDIAEQVEAKLKERNSG